jgi:hypothetical protein
MGNGTMLDVSTRAHPRLYRSRYGLPVEVWTPKGLQRFIVLFFIELSTRNVEIAGIASTANGLWMNQIVQ